MTDMHMDNWEGRYMYMHMHMREKIRICICICQQINLRYAYAYAYAKFLIFPRLLYQTVELIEHKINRASAIYHSTPLILLLPTRPPFIDRVHFSKQKDFG